MQLLDKWEQKLAMLLKSKKSLKCNRNEKASQGAFFYNNVMGFRFSNSSSSPRPNPRADSTLCKYASVMSLVIYFPLKQESSKPLFLDFPHELQKQDLQDFGRRADRLQ